MELKECKIFSIGENDDDHRPHQLFCEMDELQSNSEWKEAARWLKFEEDVENGGRWSKPHVATLSLHSLFELRSCLTSGAILFDILGEDIDTISDCFLDNVIASRHLDESKRDLLKNALLLKHVHQHEKEFKKQLDKGEKRSIPLIKSIADIDKKFSQIDLQEKAVNILPQNTSSSALSGPNFVSNIKTSDSKAKDLFPRINSKLSLSSSRADFKVNQNFMRKIPLDAEASNILVGEVDFLDHQFSALIRLKKAVVLGDFTEVPLPTRFIFIIMGPKGNINKYHEIGRSISTLLNDEIFHEIAYKAKNRQEILNGFDDFLDQVTVLPPGEWDPNIKIKPPDKIPLKEERLEKIQAEKRLNDFVNASILKSNEINPHESDPGLEFTGRFCGGLIDDYKRKLAWFWSDFKDAFNFQCLSSVLFMYFACLTPIVTFGGLLETVTNSNMSAIESLLSGLISGVLYGLFSGQPLTILGSTGPVLAFEKILVLGSEKFGGFDYMGFRAWVGLWIALILIIIVITDCNALVKYITRFTEESFASLIAIIFIYESVTNLIQIKSTKAYSDKQIDYSEDYNNTNCFQCFNNHTNESMKILNETTYKSLGSNFTNTKDCKYSPDVFFFSIFLYSLTFCLAMSFRAFKKSSFFPSNVRSKIADFGIVITIFIAVLIDWYFGIDTPKLTVPSKFQTTIPSRGWFINPITRNPDKLWLCPVAILPAILATILIFMDQNITSVIINRKENKLNKGGGYHLDLLIIAITIAINSLLGIPWFVAATVLSVNHVLSLKKESEVAAPGEKPKFLGVIEQRVTNTVVFIMIGLSVFLYDFLKLIPMAVLYGVFLYMGISSLNGIQFMHRIVIMFMPEKHQPDYTFLRHVRTFKVHIFTFMQVLSIAMLLIVKSNNTIGFLFPLMVLALVGIRKLMDYVFTQRELSYLDDIMPDIVKRCREDETDNLDEIERNDKKMIKNHSINITHELSRTNIWQYLVNNDKQLIYRPVSTRKAYSAEYAESLLISDSNKSQAPTFILNESSPNLNKI